MVGAGGWEGEAGITANDFQLYTAHAAPFCDCRRPPACANDAAQAAPALDDAYSTAICTACTGDMDAHGGGGGGGALTHHPRVTLPAGCVTGPRSCQKGTQGAVGSALTW